MTALKRYASDLLSGLTIALVLTALFLVLP